MKNFKYLSLSLVLFQSLSSKAQGLNKIYKFNTFSSSFSHVFETPDGYDAFGYTSQLTAFGIDMDILFTKLDSCGKVLKAFRYGGSRDETLIGVFKNSQGNYSLLAESNSYTSQLSPLESDVLAISLSSSGSVLKSVIIERSNNSTRRNEVISCAVSTKDNGYILSGGEGSLDLLKLNPNLDPA